MLYIVSRITSDTQQEVWFLFCVSPECNINACSQIRVECKIVIPAARLLANLHKWKCKTYLSYSSVACCKCTFVFLPTHRGHRVQLKSRYQTVTAVHCFFSQTDLAQYSLIICSFSWRNVDVTSCSVHLCSSWHGIL